MVWLLLLAGLACLILGAEILVRSGSALAARLGISSLVIGLTVVAFGTSSPELAVSAKAALSGQSDIALGNIVGSNIFNVLFILGISALISPLVVSKQLVKVDIPIMIGVSILLLLMAIDGKLSQLDGAVLFSGIISYTVFSLWLSKKENKGNALGNTDKEKAKSGRGSVGMNILLCLIGLVILVIGAKWFVEGAVTIARQWGISELVIALTIVAAGTSMPEVATSIIAALRKETDIAVGNVVGSSIFNILAILGIASLLAGPKGLSVSMGIMDFDLPVMIAVAFACLPIFFSGHIISRWEGVVFLMYYVAYVLYLILKSQEHDLLPIMSKTMWAFVIPITVLTLGVVYFQSRKKARTVLP